MYLIDPSRCYHDQRAKMGNNTVSTVKTKFKIDIEGKRCLFMAPGGFGDVTFILPVLNHIKRKAPNTKIHIAIFPQWISSFEGHPDIDHILPFGKAYDPDIRIGYDYIFDFDGAITRNEEARKYHAIDVYFRWLNQGIDLNSLNSKDRICKLTIRASSETRARQFIAHFKLDCKVIIALQMRASSPIRSWLPDYNRILARKLGEDGYTVLLFDQGNTWDFTGKNIIKVESKMIRDMSEVVALLSKCHFIIGPDSCFMQIAQALNIPSLGLYGAFPSEFRIKYGGELNQAIDCDGDAYPCSPCFLHQTEDDKNFVNSCSHGLPSPCLESITPDMVYEKSIGILHSIREKDYERAAV